MTLNWTLIEIFRGGGGGCTAPLRPPLATGPERESSSSSCSSSSFSSQCRRMPFKIGEGVEAQTSFPARDHENVI